MTTYRQALQNSFDERMKINPRYSLRAYARDLNLSAGFLSQVMSGKRGLTVKKAATIFAKIGVSSAHQKLYSLEIQKKQKRSAIKKTLIQKQIEATLQKTQAHHLQESEFEKISHWSALAMLHLLKLSDSPKKDHKQWTSWAASKLGLQESLVKSTLKTLLELKLIADDRKEGLTPSHTNVWSTNQIPSSAIRSFHKQMIEKASQSVDLQGIEERFLQSVQFSVIKSDLPLLQNDILKFRNQMLRKYGKTKADSSDSVYGMNLQLFNLLTS